MIGLGLCILGFLVTFSLTRRSIGLGLSSLFAFGYSFGLLRAVFHDVTSQFLFDSAMLGLYAAAFSQPARLEDRLRARLASNWVFILVGLPLLCLAYSPFLFDPHPIIIQLLGIRTFTITVPLLIIGARLKRSDIDTLAPALAVLNLFALGVALLEYVFGVDAILPENEVTTIIFNSKDVSSGGELLLRIPSSFIASHAYGFSVLMSLPFVVHGLESRAKGKRLLCWAGLGAGALGTFLCGARSPVIILAVATLYVVARGIMASKMSKATVLAIVVAAGITGYFVMQNERLQRFTTLEDSDVVRDRVAISANSSFFDLLTTYPFGAGLAKGGTSIPYFLMSSAASMPGVTLENEYSHILLEEGILGLGCWASIVGFAMVRRARLERVVTPTSAEWAWILFVTMWGTAFLGLGMLASIPTGSLLFLMCGMRLAADVPGPQAALSPRGARAPLSGAWPRRTPQAPALTTGKIAATPSRGRS